MLQRATLPALATAALLLLAAGPASAETITGCVTSDTGTFYNVQTGTQPLNPCEPGDQALSWNEGPFAGEEAVQPAAGPEDCFVMQVSPGSNPISPTIAYYEGTPAECAEQE
jgi:hypothetical protein